MVEEKVYRSMTKICLTEFANIVSHAVVIKGPLNTPKSLRIFLIDESFIEVYLSGAKYSYHWEHRNIRELIHRHDNAPHAVHKKIKTFPKHFHDGSEHNVKESHISDKPEKAIREFLEFVRSKLKEYKVTD